MKKERRSKGKPALSPERRTHWLDSHVRLLGSALIAAALLGAALTSARHIWSLDLAGCGPGGGCDRALQSQWGRLLGWPTAFIGLAYFASLLTLWVMTARRSVLKLLRVVLMCGGAVSILFVVVIIINGYWCPWCALTHAANLGLVGYVQWRSRTVRSDAKLNWQQLAISGLVFVGISVLAKVAELSQRLLAERTAHEAAMESIAQMQPTDPVDEATGEKPSLTVKPDASQNKTIRAKRSGFSGRYLRGNPNADVRIVIFQDYQCQLCKEVEAQISQIMSANSDVSLSVRQWPFDKACNPEIVGESMHPGACVASRVAEAAGIVGGEKGFWAVHDWLLGRGGQITVPEALDLAQRIGLDRARFEEAMNGARVDSLITADIQDGVRFGLTFTPMIFVNGYQVQGWQSAGAIPAAIARASELAKSQPRTQDRPDLAVDILFGQWKRSPVQPVSVRTDFHTKGATSSKITVTVFGDLTCPFNAMGIAVLDSIMGVRNDIRFCYRDFPLDGTCNDLVKREINPHACEAARLAEAAGQLGGVDGYWRVWRWIIANRERFNSGMVNAAAAEGDLNASDLIASMNSAAVSATVIKDVIDAKRLGIDTSPTIYVNGKRVTGWRTPGLLAKIIGYLSSAGQ